MHGRQALNVASRTLLAKTCIACGELKPGADFARYPRGWYNAQCRKCKGRYKASMRDRNQDSIFEAKNHNARWSEDDRLLLKILLEQGLSHREIALRLHRSVFSIGKAVRRYRS